MWDPPCSLKERQHFAQLLGTCVNAMVTVGKLQKQQSKGLQLEEERDVLWHFIPHEAFK